VENRGASPTLLTYYPLAIFGVGDGAQNYWGVDVAIRSAKA